MHISIFRSRERIVALTVVLLALLQSTYLFVPSARAAASDCAGPTRELISKAIGGGEGNAWSNVADGRSISTNGRYVGFTSGSTNLVDGDTNDAYDAFVRDRRTKVTHRVSVKSTGEQVGLGGVFMSLSADDQIAVFQSDAAGLVPDDNNNLTDVFAHDLSTGETFRVSVGTNGEEGDSPSEGGIISANGRFVAFTSMSTTFGGGSGYAPDIYLRDLQEGTTTRVTTNTLATYANVPEDVSNSGRYTLYTWIEEQPIFNQPHWSNYSVALYDAQSNTTTLVRHKPHTSNWDPNVFSFAESMTPDGQYVAFSTHDRTLSGDFRTYYDVYVQHMPTGTIDKVSGGPGGQETNDNSFGAALSDDGRYVSFISRASDIIPPDDQNWSRYDVYVKDRIAGTTARASAPLGPRDGYGYNYPASISGNGSIIAFSSSESNSECDANYYNDVYTVERPLGIPTAIGTSTIIEYVAMGDSYSAGEGVAPYYEGTDDVSNRCHRSRAAYPTQIRRPGDAAPISLIDPGAWRFIACSGATTYNVMANGVAQHDEPGPQLAQGVVSSRNALISITIGGNDAGFAEVLTHCIMHDCMSPLDSFMNDMPMYEWLPYKIASMPNRLNDTIAAIRSASPYADIAVLGYPRVFNPAAIGCNTADAFGIQADEQNLLNEATEDLNGVIENAALSAGATFLDAEGPFTGHEVCGSDGPWLNGIALDLSFHKEGTSGISPADYRSFHPNEAGVIGYADILNSYISGASESEEPLPLIPPTLPLNEAVRTFQPREQATATAPRSSSPSQALDSGRPGTTGRARFSHARLIGSKCDSLSVDAIAKGYKPGSTVRLKLFTVGHDDAVVAASSQANRHGLVSIPLRAHSLSVNVYAVEMKGKGPNGADRLTSRAFTFMGWCP